MALRALTATISFQDDATAAIQAVDASIDDVRSGVEGAESDFQDLSNETGEFAASASNDMGDVGSSIDDLAHDTNTLEDTTGRAADQMSRDWKKVGLAVGAAGAALEAFARSQQGMLETSARLSYSTGVATAEIRRLATEAQNATFDLEDVYATMEVGRQQGIMSGQALQDYAIFWDMVADASGESVVSLAESSVGLRAVGIAAGEEEEALAAFGYIIQNTTGTVGDFLYFLTRVGPELREMGIGLNEAAALSAALEHELGMTSQTARMELRQAVNEADGDMNVFMETIGLTDAQMEKYRRGVEESSTTVEDLAQVHYDSRTTAQHLQASIEALTHTYGAHYMPIIELLSPVLMGLAVTLGVVAAAKYVLAGATFAATKAMIGFTVAFLASPLGWVVLGVVALTGALYLLGYRFSDVQRIVQDFHRGVMETVQDIGDGWRSLVSAADEAWRDIVGVIQSAIDWLSGISLESVGKNIIDSLTSGITDGIDDLKKGVNGVADTITGGIKGALGIASPSTVMMEFGGNLAEGLYVGMENAADGLFQKAREVFPIDDEGPSVVGYRGGTISIGDIHVYSNAKDPEAVAREVSRVLRREFSEQADVYFDRLNRRR